MVVATARDGLGKHDARRVGRLEDAAQVAPAGDLLNQHLASVRARARARVRARLRARVRARVWVWARVRARLRPRVRVCDLLDSTGASRFERSFLCTQRKLISAVPTSPGWGEA